MNEVNFQQHLLDSNVSHKLYKNERSKLGETKYILLDGTTKKHFNEIFLVFFPLFPPLYHVTQDRSCTFLSFVSDTRIVLSSRHAFKVTRYYRYERYSLCLSFFFALHFFFFRATTEGHVFSASRFRRENLAASRRRLVVYNARLLKDLFLARH